MARHYYETSIIASTNSDTFHIELTKTISNWQNAGYFVEVQFTANNNQAVALILKYKEV